MRLSVIALLAIGGLVMGSAASASVLCAKKNGVVVLRAAACNKKEAPMDPVALGLQGPQGIQGVQGIQGPAGPGAQTAVVTASGAVIAQSGSLVIAPLSGPGYYSVRASTDITTKTVLVTTFATVSDGSFRGAPVYAVCGTGPNQIDCSSVPGLSNDNKTLIVVTMASGDTTPAAHGFSIAIF